MKNMKKIVVFTLLICILFGLAVGFQAGAIYDTYYYGDVDMDGQLSIVDVTYIQRTLVGLDDERGYFSFVADFDHDDKVTILDATYIQRTLASLPLPKTSGGVFTKRLVIQNFYSTYSSGKAMTGSPVIFTTCAASGGSPLIYEYAVNEEVVQHSDNPQLIYTFSESGTQEIEVTVYNVFDEYTSYDVEIEVVDPYSLERPKIVGYYYDGLHDNEGHSMLTINAIGGIAPYSYTFRIYLNGTERLPERDELKGYRLEMDETGAYYLLQDQESINESYIPSDFLAHDSMYNILVQVIDAAGEKSAVESIPFDNHIYYR